MNESQKKEFDCVAWVRQVRDNLYEEQKDWTNEKLIKHLNSFAIQNSYPLNLETTPKTQQPVSLQ